MANIIPGEPSRKVGKETERNLPLGFIQEVLLRLPFKHLCQAKCVCKTWLNLQSETQFIKSYRRRSSEAIPRIVFWRFASGRGMELTGIQFFIKDITDKKILQDFIMTIPPGFSTVSARVSSCHGLMLINDNRNVILCNPAIRDFLDISECCSKLCICPVGLGYVPSRKEYKMVAFSPRCSADEELKLCILTVVENSALTLEKVAHPDMKMPNMIGYNIIQDIQYPVCVDGFFYWPLLNENRGLTILSIDLDRSEAQIVPNPQTSHHPCSIILKESSCGNHLYLANCLPQHQIMDIYVLRKKPAHQLLYWEKMFTVDFSMIQDFANKYIPTPASHFFPAVSAEIIYVDMECKEILFRVNHDRFYVYNSESKVFHLVQNYEETGILGMVYNSCTYYEDYFPLRRRQCFS